MRNFHEWLRTLDAALRRSISDPGAWIGLLVLAGLIVALGAWIPGTRGFFRLDPVVPLILLVPTFVLGIGGGIAEQRGRLSGELFGALALIDSALLQIFTWSLVTHSQLPGASVMAVFPVLVAAYHGHAYKASRRHPWSLFATAIAAFIGAALGWSSGHVEIVAFAALAAIGSAALLGTVSLARHEESLEREALRAAVDAQILQDKVAESDRIKENLMQVHAHNHDARNTLSSVLLNMQSLLRELETRQTPDPALAEVGGDLREGLSRLQHLLGQTTNGQSLPIEQVALGPMVEQVVGEVRGRYRGVRMAIAGDPPAWDLLPICGGKLALHRVLTNLLLNACEGNGRQHAREVGIGVRESERGVEIVIEDDGPGFTPEQLVRVPTLQSDKPSGTGLGLYTTERLLRASGGSLVRANRQGGGAVVSILLPRGVQ